MPHSIRLPQASQTVSLVLVPSSPANPSVFPDSHLPLPQFHLHRSLTTPRANPVQRLLQQETSAALRGLLRLGPIPYLLFLALFTLPLRSHSPAKTCYPAQHKPVHRTRLLLRTLEPFLLFLRFGSLHLVPRQSDRDSVIEEILRNRYRLPPSLKHLCPPTTGMKVHPVSPSIPRRNVCCRQRSSRTCWLLRARRNRANSITSRLALPP